MVRSRGGVVRIEDVLASLAEAIPERVATVLGMDAAAFARLARPPVSAPDLAPMSNEPALRSVLAAAYAEAEGRPITPTMLLRAVVRWLPPTWRPRCQAISSAPRPAPPGDTVQAVLRRWLEVQSWPAAARDSALQTLATLAPPRLESNASRDSHGPAETATDAPAD